MSWLLRPVTTLLLNIAVVPGFLVSGCKKAEVLGENPVKVAQGSKLEKSALTLGVVANCHAATILVCNTRGSLQEEHLKVSPYLAQDYDGVLAGIVNGTFDGGMLPPGLVLTAVAGQEQDLIVPFVLSRNGSSIVLSRATWAAMAGETLTTGQAETLLPMSADALNVPAQAAAIGGKALAFGVESPHSSANYLLRYWLAASSLYPGVTEGASQVSPIHPSLHHATVDIVSMDSSKIRASFDDSLAGCAYSEPSNRGHSHVIAVTGRDILKNHPAAVLAVHADWAAKHPNTLFALIRGLRGAAEWLDGSQENRRQAAHDLAGVIGADVKALADGLTGTLMLADSILLTAPDHQVFARYNATAPDTAHALWTLTQIVRWGQVAGNRTDEWYRDLVSRVYRSDLHDEALGAKTSNNAKITDFIDGEVFESRTPNAYLKSQQIGLH